MKADRVRLAVLFHEAGMMDMDALRECVGKGGEASKSLLDVLSQDVSIKSLGELTSLSMRGLGELMRYEIELPFVSKSPKKGNGQPSLHEALSEPIHLSDDEAKAILNEWKPSLEGLVLMMAEAKGLPKPAQEVLAEVGTGPAAYNRLVERGYLRARTLNRAVAEQSFPLKKRCRLLLALSLLKYNQVLEQADCEDILAKVRDQGDSGIPLLNTEIKAFIDSGPDMPEIDASRIEPTEHLRRSFPESFIRPNLFVPCRHAEGVLEIAASDPLYSALTDTLAVLTGLPVLAFYVPSTPLMGRIAELYPQAAPSRPAAAAAEGPRRAVSAPARREAGAGAARPAEPAPEQLGDRGSAVEIVSSVIETGIAHHATDIHLEPHNEELRVRYRIDGMLRPIMAVRPEQVLSVISRIKVLANLDVTERRHPQDGHFSLSIGEGAFDFRVSTLPTHLGEKVVIRILDESRVRLDPAELGMSTAQVEMLGKWIRRPHGLVLVTGPTGSGKTSTLYAALNSINDEAKNIVTIEDPVEYRLPGINQVQVDPNIELGFASGLRATLRQDPDVIMVGEIRDPETARIAMRASLTGHLVFSTLHTNTAVGAIATLGQMNVESFMITSATTGVISQRLVRCLCPKCKKSFAPTKELLRSLRLETTSRKRMWRAVGCEECLGTGYLGRVGVFELFPITDDVKEGILAGKSEAELAALAQARGCQTLLGHAVEKVYAGQTSPQEVIETLIVEE